MKPELFVKVLRDTWRTTTLRLIRAEQEAERATTLMNAATDAGTAILRNNEKLQEGIRTAENWAEVGIPAAKQAGIKQGREEVLKLIARWGKCRPLEGMGGADMAEALRKVLTPTLAPYNDYVLSQLCCGGGPTSTAPYSDGEQKHDLTRYPHTLSKLTACWCAMEGVGKQYQK